MTKIIDKIGPFNIKKFQTVDLKQCRVTKVGYGVFLQEDNEFLHEFSTLVQARKACKDRLDYMRATGRWFAVDRSLDEVEFSA